ncbi:hypothetical protein [Bacillus toyonensis]|uniref:Serine protease n=1 Tax=Bacillus toyonensis TaxID=155322 RepID=A0A2A8H8I2_9BACI|nr:hypothetical protein [Bacillus toyonensis]PEP96513.1 hypothetical protein CN585_25435 [Bacillus toyonensis]
MNATVDVKYRNGWGARFQDQIVTTNLSSGGDSGSLITTNDGVAIVTWHRSIRKRVINIFSPYDTYSTSNRYILYYFPFSKTDGQKHPPHNLFQALYKNSKQKVRLGIKTKAYQSG